MKIVALFLVLMALVSLVIYLVKKDSKQSIEKPVEIQPVVKKKRVYKKKPKKV